MVNVTNDLLRAELTTRFVDRARTAALELRKMADDIERTAQLIHQPPRPGQADAGTLAARIVRTLTLGLASANPDQIICAAADIDHLTGGAR